MSYINPQYSKEIIYKENYNINNSDKINYREEVRKKLWEMRNLKI